MAHTTPRVHAGQVRTGMPVGGPEGDTIGWVHSLSGALTPTSEAYVVVRRKFQFFRTGWLFVPMSAIALVEGGEVLLEASPSEIPREAWQRRV